MTFLAVAALAAGDTHRALASPALRRAGSAVSVTVLAFGLYMALVYVFDYPELWIGELGGLPSLWAGLILVVMGASVPMSVSRIEARVVAGQIASLLVFSASAVILLGYLYGDISVGMLFRPPEIAFQAVLISLLTAVGIFLIRPGSGLLATASSPGPGGRILRRFGPVVLLLPAFLLLIVEVMPNPDRVDALAFISVGLGLFLLVFLSIVVSVINDAAIAASTAVAQAQRAQIGLGQEAPLVMALAEALHVVEVERSAEVDVATRFRPGRGSVAGDASAVRTLPDRAIGVVLVDLTGHGADPAIRALRVRDLLVHSLAHGRTPAEAMALVGWSAPGDVLASAIAMRIEPSSGSVLLASAGHPPVIWVRTQEARMVEPTGPLLYLDPEAAYTDRSFNLGRGDSLILYSDGVADVQRERDGRSEPAVLADLLLAEGGVASRSADLVLGFADSDPSDDQTVLVARLEP